MKIVAFRDRNPLLVTLFILISILIIAKFGPYVYAMLIAIYIIVYYIKLYWVVYFHPKNPYNMFPRLMKGCFSLDNSIWLDPNLESEFDALFIFCKNHKTKITIYSEQLDVFGKTLVDAPPDSEKYQNAKNAIVRMEKFQRFGHLKVLPPVPAKSPTNVSCEQENEDANCINNTSVEVNVTHPPKPIPPAKRYVTALTHYAGKCKSSFVSRDEEVRIRVKHFNELNPDKSIEVVMFPLFVSACEFINRFRITIVEKHKEAKRLRGIKVGDLKKGFKETMETFWKLLKK